MDSIEVRNEACRQLRKQYRLYEIVDTAEGKDFIIFKRKDNGKALMHISLDQTNKRLYNKLTKADYGCVCLFFTRNTILSLIRKTAFDLVQQTVGDDQAHLGKIATNVLRIVYGASTEGISKMLGSVLWKMLDPDVLKLTINMRGIKATSADYTLVWNNFEDAKELWQKTPGICPIWLYLCKVDFIKQGGAIKTTKAWLEDQELTPKGWRYLIKLKPLYVNTVLKNAGYRMSCFVKCINSLADIGEMPRYFLFKQFVTAHCGGMIPSRDLMPSEKAVYLKAFQEGKKSKQIKRFYHNELSLVLDWLVRDNAIIDKNQAKAPWSWFMRKQEEWHEKVLQEKISQLKESNWESLLGKIEYQGYDIVPLTSSLDLFEEGQEMHHCVSSYANNCKNGMSRIFSIKKDGKSVATCEIRPMLSHWWSVHQVRGHSNKDPGDAIKHLANHIALKYSEQQNETRQIDN